MIDYRVYKGEEVYCRNIHYIGKYVLSCPHCGNLGTYDSIEDVEEAKKSHNRLHDSDD